MTWSRRFEGADRDHTHRFSCNTVCMFVYQVVAFGGLPSTLMLRPANADKESVPCLDYSKGRYSRIPSNQGRAFLQSHHRPDGGFTQPSPSLRLERESLNA